jgi:hypothetical protein
MNFSADSKTNSLPGWGFLLRYFGDFYIGADMANTILSMAWYLLTHQQPYQDLGADYFHRLEGATAQRYYIKQLQKMGFRVTLEPLDKAA